MRNWFLVLLSLFIITIAAMACSKLQPAARADNQLLDGPIDGLSNAEQRQFLAGDIAFNEEVFTAATGLGSIFVASSCGSCHAGDGKGHPFTTLTRFGQTDSTGNRFLHLGGPQLQNNALPGFVPEQIPAGATFSRFTPPANTGLGLLEAVTDQSILDMADPLDLNGDGISGVPNWDVVPLFTQLPATAIARNGKYIHRFGKKAAAFNLVHQTVNAYSQDMGIASSFIPADVYSGNSIDPEVTDRTIQDVVFYLRTLKAPIPRQQQSAQIIEGGRLFIQAGCEGCHRQTLHTGPSPVAALANKTFHPYTDLLLHDMGPALDDGYTEGSATTAEWRTPPLWGLGLSPASQGGAYFLMHDGRAASIEAAIGLHGGEADRSRSNFMQMSVTEQQTVIQFLKSL